MKFCFASYLSSWKGERNCDTLSVSSQRIAKYISNQLREMSWVVSRCFPKA